MKEYAEKYLGSKEKSVADDRRKSGLMHDSQSLTYAIPN